MRKTLFHATLAVVVLALAALPAAAKLRTIDAGSDFWMTLGDGRTLAKFDTDPLPADFFCSGSAPFAGKVVMQGVPVVTSPNKALSRVDTVIERLDQAVFDRKGEAVTRIQVRAMRFEGVEQLVNECGAFKVALDLEGPQPVTKMRIFREGPDGGRFEAEIFVNVKISFTPVDHKAEVVSVSREVRFPAYQGGVWATKPGKGGVEHLGFVQIDTDADGIGDTYVAGTSPGFAAGWPAKSEDGGALKPKTFAGILPGDTGAEVASKQTILAEPTCEIYCHCDECGIHCPSPAETQTF